MIALNSLLLRSLLFVAVVNLAFANALASGLQSPSQPAARYSAGSRTKLTGRPWKLISLNGHDLDATLPKVPQVSLIENGTRILGYAGCNRFLATYSLEQHRLTVNSDLLVTHLACHVEMDVERDFLKALQSIDSWKIVKGVLELSRQNQVLARFKQAIPPK